MIPLRSTLFDAWFYASMAVIGLTCLVPSMLWRPVLVWTMRAWTLAIVWGMRVILKTPTEFRGLEHLPKDAPVLFAARHQSTYDTLAPFKFIADPAFILKRELMATPVFGWYCRRAGMIPIDREGSVKALKTMIAGARDAAARGRSVVIFPEGTRQPVDADVELKPGVAALYRALDLPCAPVAVNTGLCWPPSGGGPKRPGRIVFEVLPMIEPGLSRQDFMVRLTESLQSATTRLVAEGREAQAQTAKAGPVQAGAG